MKIGKPGTVAGHGLHRKYRIKGGYAMAEITMKQAQAVLQAALNKAEEIDTKMDIAVVDAGANLKSFVRMDEAWIGSIDIAIKKARSLSE